MAKGKNVIQPVEVLPHPANPENRVFPYAMERKVVDGEAPIIQYIGTDLSEDRYGSVIDPKGADTSAYMQSGTGVFCFGHRYDIPVVGKCIDLVKKGNALIFTIRFATEIWEGARIVYELVKNDYMPGSSIGFIPKAYEDYDAQTVSGYFAENRKYTKWELLELSSVPVPANRNALKLGLEKSGVGETAIRALGLDAFMRGEMLYVVSNPFDVLAKMDSVAVSAEMERSVEAIEAVEAVVGDVVVEVPADRGVAEEIAEEVVETPVAVEAPVECEVAEVTMSADELAELSEVPVPEGRDALVLREGEEPALVAGQVLDIATIVREAVAGALAKAASDNQPKVNIKVSGSVSDRLVEEIEERAGAAISKKNKAKLLEIHDMMHDCQKSIDACKQKLYDFVNAAKVVEPDADDTGADGAGADGDADDPKKNSVELQENALQDAGEYVNIADAMRSLMSNDGEAGATSGDLNGTSQSGEADEEQPEPKRGLSSVIEYIMG